MRSKILLLLCYALLTATALADSNAPNEPDDKTLRTIQPHTRSAAVNAKHAQECAEMGGVDETDEHELKIGGAVEDTLVCRITNVKQEAKYAASKGTAYYKEVNGHKEKVDLSQQSLSNGLVSVLAPNGVYPAAPTRYNPIAVIEFSSAAAGLSYSGAFYVDGDYEPFSGNMCGSYLTGGRVPKDGVRYVLSSSCAGSPGKRISRTYAWVGSSGTINDYGVIEHPDITKPKNEGMPDNPPSCNMPSSFIADPINIAVGNSFQHEVDISGSGAYPLAFIRYYNSVDGIWRHNYSSSVKPSKLYPDTLELTLADGRVVYFPDNKGVITPPATELGTLKRLGTGYQYTSPFHEVLDFDDDGYLTRMTSNGGIRTNITHTSAGIIISNDYGYVIRIAQNSNQQPISVELTRGTATPTRVNYEYDSENRLIKVVGDNGTREYHYEDTRFPRALTSITNENGVRYATWTYDDKGRANSNMHAGNKDKVSITYNSDSQTTFTNPLGRKYTYNYTVIDGLKRITSISGAASSLCPAIGSSYQYNAKGLVIAATDGRGIKTTYEYNDAGQETSRTIANGKATAVTIKTTWDDRFNLPKTETYPDKVITYSYDAYGNVTNQTVQSLS